ncbi:MAG: helix-turn-helix transcriptional regulator, partial [Spirochaetia bacterium]|nr:helix-turn-helix transcriptional regulator [Spirochaetia bacterium]
MSQLFLILSGDGRFVFDKKEIPFAAGRIFFAPPCKRHGFINAARKPIWTLEAKFYLHEPRLKDILKNLDLAFYDEEEGLRILLESMVREGIKGGAHHREIASARLLELLWLLARQGDAAPATNKNRPTEAKQNGERERASALTTIFDPMVRSLVGTIEARLHEPLSLKQVAGTVGFTTRHVSERFRQVTGETVLDWLWIRRVERAKRLMLES